MTFEDPGKIVVLGASGRLGKWLAKNFPSAAAPSSAEADITVSKDVLELFDRLRPNVVVNAAALVGAAPCEEDPNRAWLVNVAGVANIVQACGRFDAKLVQISTAVVFDGRKGDYKEEDETNPTYLYAVTKRGGEVIAGSNPKNLVVRTDFFSKESFKYNRVFSDHYTTKEPADAAAKKVAALIRGQAEGLFHIGGRRDALYNILKPGFPDIAPCKIAESPLPDFPRDISLNTDKFEKFVAESREGCGR